MNERRRRILRNDIKVIENKSFWFILPMLGMSPRDFHNLRGCFIGAEEHPQFANQIFVLTVWEPSEQYNRYIEEMKRRYNYKYSYMPDKFHTMLVFDIPLECEKDYKKIRDGKYSTVSPDYKKHLVKFHNIRAKHKFVQILYKDPELKTRWEAELGVTLPEDSELSSVFDPEKEMYKEEMKIITNTPNIDSIST